MWEGWASVDSAAPDTPPAAGDGRDGFADGPLRAELDKRLAEGTRKAFEGGRERGRQEGRQAEREAQAASQATAEQQRVRQTVEMIESFAQERERYLRAVEDEVVKLALAVAARILRREAQMDPLLLTGAVRVALGQLSGSTQVKLRVPAAELDLWTEAIALVPNLAAKPAVVAGEGMRLGECLIETGLGSVDLGIRVAVGRDRAGLLRSRRGAPGRQSQDGSAGQSAPSLPKTRRAVHDAVAGPILWAAGTRPALALARAGTRVGGPDDRVGGAAGLGGRVLRDSGPVRPRASGRGDWLSRIECAVDAGREHGGHPLWEHVEASACIPRSRWARR